MGASRRVVRWHRAVHFRATDTVSIHAPHRGLNRRQRQAAIDPWPTRSRKGTSRQSKQWTFVAAFVVAAVVLSGVGSRASAADEWFVLSEEIIKSVDQGVEIKSQGDRWTKDVKQVKLSVERADVELKKVVLQWDNRKDDTITDIGVLKAGGQTRPWDAPGRKGRLTAVTVEYKIVGEALAAEVKVWGYD